MMLQGSYYAARLPLASSVPAGTGAYTVDAGILHSNGSTWVGGPAQSFTVPNVVGMFYQDAQLALADAGLLIQPPALALSNTVAPQYVIGQSIAAGTAVGLQTPITITVVGFPVLNTQGVTVPVL